MAMTTPDHTPKRRPSVDTVVEVPSIKPDEILVKITSASLCHSDLMLFETNEQGLKLGEGDPFTMVSVFLLIVLWSTVR